MLVAMTNVDIIEYIDPDQSKLSVTYEESRGSYMTTFEKYVAHHKAKREGADAKARGVPFHDNPYRTGPVSPTDPYYSSWEYGYSNGVPTVRTYNVELRERIAQELPTPASTGQIRTRFRTSNLATRSNVIIVGHINEIYGAHQIYDAVTGRPVGGWSPGGVVEDWPMVIGTTDDIHAYLQALGR